MMQLKRKARIDDCVDDCEEKMKRLKQNSEDTSLQENESNGQKGIRRGVGTKVVAGLLAITQPLW